MYIGGIIIDSRLEFSVCFDYFVTGKLRGCYEALWGNHGEVKKTVYWRNHHRL